MKRNLQNSCDLDVCVLLVLVKHITSIETLQILVFWILYKKCYIHTGKKSSANLVISLWISAYVYAGAFPRDLPSRNGAVRQVVWLVVVYLFICLCSIQIIQTAQYITVSVCLKFILNGKHTYICHLCLYLVRLSPPCKTSTKAERPGLPFGDNFWQCCKSCDKI